MAKRPYLQTARFELRCTPEELERWRAVAASHGVSLAAYIREVLNQNDAKISDLSRNVQKRSQLIDPALIRQIAAIGNNLNQIAHWCNAHKSQLEAESVEEEIHHTWEALVNLLEVVKKSC